MFDFTKNLLDIITHIGGLDPIVLSLLIIIGLFGYLIHMFMHFFINRGVYSEDLITQIDNLNKNLSKALDEASSALTQASIKLDAVHKCLNDITDILHHWENNYPPSKEDINTLKKSVSKTLNGS